MTASRPSGGESPADGRRLDVFALPAETTFRFILLVLVTLAAGFFVADWLFWSLGGDNQEIQTTLRCGRLVNDLGAGNRLQAAPILAACTDPIQHRSGLAAIAGAVAILGVGGLLCCVAPAIRMRRRRLRPLRGDVPAVAEAVEELCGEVGLRRFPEAVWNPLDGGTSALAFGAFGRHRIALGAGLVATHFRDPGRFRAVLMHELAHVRNRDVTLAYMSVFVWWAFVLVGVVPFTFTLFDEQGDTIRDLGWRLAALTALVYLGRNAVLRAREAYADARAARWLGSPDPLTELLPSGETTPTRRSPRDAVRALRGFTAVHPAPSLRARLLGHPEGLMRLSPFVALAAGIAAGVSFSEAKDATTLMATGGAESLATTWAALASVPLAIGVVVVAGWRATMAAGALRRPPPTGVLAGIAVAAGLFVGGLVAPGQAIPFPGESAAGRVDVIWAATLTVLAALFTGLAVVGAEAWLGAVREGRHARAALAVGWIVTGAAFAWLVGQAVPLIELLRLGVSLGPRDVILYLADKEVTLAVLASVAVFPVVAQLIRGRAALPWRTAIVAVAAAGLAFLVVAVAWRLIVHATVSLDERKTSDFFFHYQNSHEAIAVGLAAAAACGVALRGGRWAAPLGLIAALATVGLAVAAFMGLVTAGSCAESLSIRPPGPGGCPTGISGSYLWQTFVRWGSEAMLLAMVAMPTSLLVRHLGGRVRPAPAPAAIATRAPRPTAARGGGGLALPLATVAFGVAALAGTVALIALARAETPKIGVPTAAGQLRVPGAPSGTGTWTDKLAALCLRAATEIREARRAPAGQSQAAVAQRVRVLSTELKRIGAPVDPRIDDAAILPQAAIAQRVRGLITKLKRIGAPADARVDDASTLLGGTARNLDLAAVLLAHGRRAAAQRFLRSATREGHGAEVFLAANGALECSAIGF